MHNENELRSFVNREVLYCLSTLVNTLYKDGIHSDDLMPVIAQDDWSSAANDKMG
jgi:hypothetical protein